MESSVAITRHDYHDYIGKTENKLQNVKVRDDYCNSTVIYVHKLRYT